MDDGSPTLRIKAEAERLGFDLVGVVDVRPSDHADFYRDWISAGRHGSMAYLAREDAVRRRVSPDGVFRSAVVVGLNYYTSEQRADERTSGRTDEEQNQEDGIIARYARGRDYHKVIKSKLLALLRFVEAEIGRELSLSRAYVDTGPVLERELARRAGLGWFGRNTMILNPKRGSYFFLGALLLELRLEADEPFEQDHCGTCNACVTACPTGALLGRDASGAPAMDATRCISYLTIENRGPIPRELRPLMGNRIFGCDICQEVCPWNSEKFVTLTREPAFRQRGSEGAWERRKTLISLMRMNEEEWDLFSRGSAIRRAKRAGFLRNVAVGLGNWGSPEAVPVLSEALRDLEPLVRGHAAWALGRINTEEAIAALRDALTLECNAFVREELMVALNLANVMDS